MRFASRYLLLIAEVLFLSTFLAAEPLERLADAGQIPAREIVYLYASRWRHGMTGNWPLYMPGFFAVAITVWFWALGRTPRQMIREGAGLTLLALLVAFLLQPWCAAKIMHQFQTETGMAFLGQMPSNSAIGIFRSVYTLLTFGIGIVSIQIAIERLRLWPLALPVVMNLILSVIRPWTVTDFTGFWMTQVFDLNPVATFSLLAAMSTAVVMLLGLLIWSRRGGGRFGSTAKSERQSQGADR